MISLCRLGILTDLQLHLIFVERVDQRLEPGGLIPAFGASPGNAHDDDRVIFSRNGQIIGCAARLCAQALEGENSDALQRLGHMQFSPAMHVNIFRGNMRSEEHTSELQSLMRISYAVFCLTKKNKNSALA